MPLSCGDKLLVSHRRLFERDEARYFVGTVEAYADGVVKVCGYSFVRDVMSGKVIRKNDLRSKVLSIASGMFLVYQLPAEVDVEQVRFELKDAELDVTDGKGFAMNMTEAPHRGHI